MGKYATPQHRLNYCLQIVSQWFRVYDNDVGYVDIKPENILCYIPKRHESDEKIDKERSLEARVQLIDFGGSFNFRFRDSSGKIDFNKLNNLIKKISRGPHGIYTPGFVSLLDLLWSVNVFRHKFSEITDKEISEQTDQETLEKVLEMVETVKSFLEKRAVFALGATCFAILTTAFPYPARYMKMDWTPQTEAECNPGFDLGGLLKSVASEKVYKTIQSMVCYDFQKRPGRKEVEAMWKEISLGNGINPAYMAQVSKGKGVAASDK